MTSDRPIIEAQKLVKAYGFLPVLRGLTLQIPRGEFVALLGANGSGKSTFIRLLTGLSRPTAGILRIGGWELPQEAAAVRTQIGLVSHRSLIYENLTARENLTFFGRLYDIPEAQLSQRIETLLDQVGLSKRADEPTRNYSRGMQQRLSIARALLHQPAVLLFDEPHTGLDADAIRMLDNALKSAQADGHTIIMVTHELDKAAELADRVLILTRGVVGYDASTHGMTHAQLTTDYAEVTDGAR